MAEPKTLIVNADDFGLSPAVNAGVIGAYEHGVVRSASLMVRQPAAAEAAELAGLHSGLAVGLHLDLGQWDYRAGEWVVAYTRCDTDDASAVRTECLSQLDLFRGLIGRDPSHVDSHQHVHNSEPVRSAASEICGQLGVPLRGREIRYEGGFYGQTGRGEALPAGITVAAISALIRSLEAGWTELGCHPGLRVRGESTYAQERERELQTLCDPTVAALLAAENVRLSSFLEWISVTNPLGGVGSRE